MIGFKQIEFFCHTGTTIETWVHFSGLAVCDGRVFAVDRDSNVYAFGLPAPSSR